MENYHEMRFTFTNTAAAVVRRSRPVKAADRLDSSLPTRAAGRSLAGVRGVRARRVTELRL